MVASPGVGPRGVARSPAAPRNEPERDRGPLQPARGPTAVLILEVESVGPLFRGLDRGVAGVAPDRRGRAAIAEPSFWRLAAPARAVGLARHGEPIEGRDDIGRAFRAALPPAAPRG